MQLYSCFYRNELVTVGQQQKEAGGWMQWRHFPAFFSVLIIPLVFSHPLSFPLSGGVQLWHCIPSKMTPVGGPRFIAMPLYQLH